MNKIRIFDLESDYLLDRITTIHCLCYYDVDSGISRTCVNYQEIRELFEEEGVIWLGHNIIKFDLPALQKIIGIKEPEKVIDTLSLSWYLFPDRRKHGLEEWGEELGVEKPKIEDWGEGNIEAIKHRCAEDVKINTRLWWKEEKILEELYPTEAKLWRFIEYLTFKLQCVREQEEIGLLFNKESCITTLNKLEGEKEIKTKELEEVMPKRAIKKEKKYKDVAIDKEGNLFVKGDIFYQAAVEAGASIKDEHSIATIKGWEEPNSNSNIQLKDWLYSLGWEPENIKHLRDKKTNIVKKIPQIAHRLGGGEICDSVKKLFEKEPKLELLEGLTVMSHRIGMLNGFLEEVGEGERIFPSMAGLTNTLRLKHKVVVNLPAVEKKYGKEIRELLIADEGNILCGSDLANIEDRTKRHYIYKYDPKYVEEMNVPGYDAHLELGVLAGYMTQDDLEFYKAYKGEDKERYSKLKAIRNKSKISNFSATYKIGAEALSRNANMSLKDARKLLKTYWERNKAILKVENECLITQAGGQRWLQNPISGFWYSLRNDKDKFSTLNQGTAVYVFDLWVKYMREQEIKIALQYHDEVLFNVKEGEQELIQKKINRAIELVNEELKLNVPVGCSIQWGKDYSSVH